MFLAAILVLVIYIGIIVAATVIASRKGRSAIGWCILTIIFPIAILFVAIAAPAHAYAQPPSASTVQSNRSRNELDAQVVSSLKKNPMVFGLLAFLPVIAYAFSYSSYNFYFWQTWLTIIIPGFIFYFIIFWILGIGITYRKYIFIVIAICVPIINWILLFLVLAELPIHFMGSISRFLVILDSNLGFWVSAWSGLFYIPIIFLVYVLQKRIKTSSEN